MCGFHIAFISVHLPPYLTDQGMSKGLAAWALSLIGLFNVIGAYTSGILGGHHPRRLLLSGIYLGRGLAYIDDDELLSVLYRHRDELRDRSAGATSPT